MKTYLCIWFIICIHVLHLKTQELIMLERHIDHLFILPPVSSYEFPVMKPHGCFTSVCFHKAIIHSVIWRWSLSFTLWSTASNKSLMFLVIDCFMRSVYRQSKPSQKGFYHVVAVEHTQHFCPEIPNCFWRLQYTQLQRDMFDWFQQVGTLPGFWAQQQGSLSSLWGS